MRELEIDMNEKMRKYHIEYRSNHKEKCAAAVRSSKAKKLKKGICPNCNKNNSLYTKTLCIECACREANRGRKKSGSKSITLQQYADKHARLEYARMINAIKIIAW